jgi:hypothetical protein
MPFQRGNQYGKNTKRTKNKNTANTKDAIANYFESGNMETLFREIDELEGKDKVSAKLKLLEYYLPKLKAVDLSTTIEDKREELTNEEIEAKLKQLKEDMKMFEDD